MIKYFYSIVIHQDKKHLSGVVEFEKTPDNEDIANFIKEISKDVSCKIEQIQIICFSRL